MFSTLPTTTDEFKEWPWSRIEPYFHDLQTRSLQPNNIKEWLADWSHIDELLYETHERLLVALTLDTTDKKAEEAYNQFLDNIFPNAESADQKLKEILLASNLKPAEFQIPLRNIQSDSEIFRQSNIPLLTQELKLCNEFDKLIGAQTVVWEGKETTITQLEAVYRETDRQKREQAWRLSHNRQLEDQQAINDLWIQFMELRGQIAKNANLPDYRSYRWLQLHRFDYTPQDCFKFQQSIEEVVVPAAQRLYDRRRELLKINSLKPWDIYVDPKGLAPLKPFSNVVDFEQKTEAVLNNVDLKLAAYFNSMRQTGLLDLENRKGKAPGGYCTEFAVSRQPFIFMNAVGIHDDVQTLLHESGHAFHVFESAHLPYLLQREVGYEFAEVASISMELLSSPYLSHLYGGFYSESDAARATVELLETSIYFWPYMAVVDAFQHWVYDNHKVASDPSNCDSKWSELWDRFMPGEDWDGLKNEKETGWQRKHHIHQSPFYYVEYGLAQLGAFQIWQKAQKDQKRSVTAYRKALSLGGTESLPQLFTTAGAKLAFDQETLKEAVKLAEMTICELDSKIEASTIERS